MAKSKAKKSATPSTKLAKPEKKPMVNAAEAKERTSFIKAAFLEMGKSWWKLGAQVRQALEDGVHQALGKSAHEWMQELFGDSWLRIYRANRAITALKKVPLEKLQTLSEGNAYALARLPEKTRSSPEWVDKAAKLKNEDFKEAVEKHIEKKTKTKRDPMVPLSRLFGFTTAPKSLAESVKLAMKLAGIEHELDMDSKKGRLDAFEAIFADYIGGHSQAQTENPNGQELEVEPFTQDNPAVEGDF